MRFFVLFVCIYLVSCSVKTNEDTKIQTVEKHTKEKLPKLNIDESQYPTLENWLNSYRKNDAAFHLSQFIFSNSITLGKLPGNIYGTFDEEFDPIYSDFLIYRNDKKQYIDMDSYNWFVDDNNTAGFEIDQEINWVNIEEKKIYRIVFRGSSEWVEDVFWKNDSVVFLLENNYYKCPKITSINLSSGKGQQFVYNDTLAFTSTYTKERLAKKGILLD